MERASWCPASLLYMKTTITDYIVECGNWKVKVALDDNEHDVDYAYIEAGTRAIEAIFGMRGYSMQCELIGLKTPSGDDYFDAEGEFMVNMPSPLFSLVLCVYKASDALTFTKWRLYLSSMIFANAAQPINVELALHAESLEKDLVNKFKKMLGIETKNKKKS